MTETRLIPAARIARQSARAEPSPRGFTRMFTAGAAVVALVLSTTLPARAAPDGEDYLKTIIGLAIIGAIAKSANDKKKDRDDDHYVPAPKPGKDKGRRIPASCAIEIAGKKRDAVVYPESCLREAGVTRNLPRNCSNEAKIFGEWDRIYSAECLRSAGFRVGISPND
ncbi:hypothetical protein [Xinfangfangia pollutisoli]|uniref:hypothetical protein n=1 Tax=Xinfangfangia pollutisoli TaxID=2865960 RepID=UPI001CD30DCB|nr:hypothetical protein [Xinfangfangia pollutisoli]